MERKEIISKLNEVFEEVLDLDEKISLTETTTADDIDEWDSLSHVQLIVAIEKEFHIKFSSKELASWKTVGDMVDCICSK